MEGRAARVEDDGLSWRQIPRAEANSARVGHAARVAGSAHRPSKVEGRPARASSPLRTCQVQRTGYFFFFAAFFFVPFFFAAFFLAAM